MGTLKLTYTRTEDEDNDYCLTASDFEKFNTTILDLGDISADGKYFESLAAIFDLEAFTSFTNQIDPHLIIPDFLNEFLSWLFQSISSEFRKRKEEDKVILWGELPFFAKFLGDGVLFLWDTETLSPDGIGNVVIVLRNICNKYTDEFYPQIRKSFTKPPTKLRCGIARGQIISIGEGKDFVGPCINVASRLQKIGRFSFAISKRGFNLSKHFHKDFNLNFVLIKAPIRGVGDEELIYVRKNEFDSLSDEEKREFMP